MANIVTALVYLSNKSKRIPFPVDWMFNVTINDITVIYVTTHSCAGGFKKLDLRSGSCWLVVLRINVDLAIFQPYLDSEAGDNQSLKIQVVRRGIEPRSSCSTSQELNHSATAAPRSGS